MSYRIRVRNIQRKLTPRLLRPWILPRLPLRELFETERIILNRVERDEIIAKPDVLEYVTTNVILPTYARKLVSDGHKWIVWPEVPTGDYSYTKKGIDVGADETITLLRALGRGEIQWIVMIAGDSGFEVQVQCDDRITFNMSLSDLFDVAGLYGVPNMAFVVQWSPTDNIYGIALAHQERFTEMLEVRIHNPGGGPKPLIHAYIHLHFHEIAELYAKYPALKDPRSRVTVY